MRVLERACSISGSHEGRKKRKRRYKRASTGFRIRKVELKRRDRFGRKGRGRGKLNCPCASG